MMDWHIILKSRRLAARVKQQLIFIKTFFAVFADQCEDRSATIIGSLTVKIFSLVLVTA